MNDLRRKIAAIVEAIAEGNEAYWSGYEAFGILDQGAVINDIMKAIMECDGDEVLKAFGAA